ncbi:UNVERIFIED_CONTAM: Kinesin-like protein KIN-14I [Sesamum calycinum]|uniref:Kinesin-like protein KIN-14I n=1 Tax=Sesamum calycinum TaxID=2727403 RepID=A0AAW2SHJ5_9LAMI
MAALEGALSFSVASVVEDVLQQHGGRSRGLDLDARRAEEAAIRRYEAAAWLRKVVGVVSAKDLPAEPSEEEFRLGLRSGIILCNALNKVQPGAVPKVVESPYDSSHIPDGAALSAYQYFENVRNFLVAVEEMGMPTFEASDLEQGGKSSRVVNCVLALKSYNEWKQTGGNGVWKFGGNVKTSPAGKQFVRKNSEPFTGSLSRSMSINERSQNGISADTDFNRTSSSSLSMLVRAILLDKKPEEVPNLIESVLSKVVEEFENRVASQMELKKASFRDFNTSHGSKSVSKPSASNVKTEQNDAANPRRDDIVQNHSKCDEESESRLMKQQLIVDQQQEDITVLKQTLSITKAGMQFMQMKFHEEIHNLDCESQSCLSKERWEPVSQQQKISGSPCSMQPSFLQPNLNASLQSPNGLRKPMEDVGNIEVHRNSASRQKRQSLDLDELLGNSPTWPSVNSPCQNNGDDERELISSGEWVDKLMVNKQDPVCGDENPLATWQPNNSNISDAIYQKYLSDSTKYYSDKSFGLYPANDQFDVNTTDDFDELDAGTSDSSEPDLLWQFNHSKLGGFTNGTGPKVQKPNIKQSKSPEFRTMIPKLGPSPSRKAVREGGQGHPPPRSGRQTTETKRKTGSRK